MARVKTSGDIPTMVENTETKTYSEAMTRLTPAQVQEIEQWWSIGKDRTHYELCWKDHYACALASLIASHRAVVENLEQAEWTRDVLATLRNADALTIGKLERQIDDNAQCCEERIKVQAEATRLREALQAVAPIVKEWINPEDEKEVAAYQLMQQALTGQEAQDD